MKTESKKRGRSEKELPPFHSAARQGNKEELNQLLRNHPDLIDYGDSNGDTALMHAVLSKHVECLRILLEAGSKTEVKDSQGRTALLLSAAKGWRTGFEILRSFNANCQVIDINNRNALHFSSCLDQERCLQTILTHMGIKEINQRDVEGMTPLHWAAFHNRPKNIELLLQNGADPIILDHENKSPLHWAAQNGCLDVCKMLLCTDACKSIINLKSQEGRSPLHLAAAAGHLDVLFELTQGFGCDVDLGDAEGRTALHWACAMGEYRCVAGLLRLGVPHYPVDNYGITPVAYAKQLNHSNCVSLFEMYDPKRPQRVLIPMKENDKSWSKCNSENLSHDDLVNDAFSLSVSHENEQRQIDNIRTLHSQISNNTYNIQELKHALSEVLHENICKESEQTEKPSESMTPFSNGSDANKLINSDESGNVFFGDSEDESRYQTQMAISPSDRSLDSSPEFMVVDNKHETVDRKTSKNLQLAPIKGRISKQRTLEELNRLELSPLTLRKTADKRKVQRFSKHSMVIPKPVREDDQRDSPLLHITSSTTTLLQRPLGLRRKSVSLNDGLSQIEQSRTQQLHIVRTQSNGFIKNKQRKLPIITASGGRNLTQQWTDHIHMGIDDGYEGFDEKSHTSTEGLSLDKKKKRIKKRDKLSLYES